MGSTFEVAGGSFPGSLHLGRGRLPAGRNNQDAFGWCRAGSGLGAVVADGCGSANHSECGARVGAGLFLGSLERHLERRALDSRADGRPVLEAILEEARRDLLSRLRILAGGMSGPLEENVRRTFLFTLLGVLISGEEAALFSVGDGLFAVDGTVTRLGPFPGNAPTYLGYGLMDNLPSPFRGDSLRFRVHRRFSTRSFRSLMIGTDGVGDFIDCAGRFLPGRSEKVGPVSQFWEQDRYFRNPDAIRRRLALANSRGRRRGEDGVERNEEGLLPDDTTVVVIRRNPEEKKDE